MSHTLYLSLKCYISILERDAHDNFMDPHYNCIYILTHWGLDRMASILDNILKSNF